MNSDTIVAFALPATFISFAWIIFTTFRRYKIARLQADVQTKLLDKVASQDLLAYAQTDAGRQLLESLKVEQVVSPAPYNKIIGALQAGIVLFCFGLAMLWLRGHISHDVDGFTALGAISIAVGLGFGFSAVASYYLSRSFGLLNGTHS